MDTEGSVSFPRRPNVAAKTPPPFSGLNSRPSSGTFPGSELKK